MQIQIHRKKAEMFSLPEKTLQSEFEFELDFHHSMGYLFWWTFYPEKLGKTIWVVAENDFTDSRIIFPVRDEKLRIFNDFSKAMQVLLTQLTKLTPEALSDYLDQIKTAGPMIIPWRSPMTSAAWKQKYKSLISTVVKQNYDEQRELIEINQALNEKGESNLIAYMTELRFFYSIYHDGLHGKFQRVKLDVTLHVNKEKIKREIEVPASFTFEELHDVIQEVFNWDNAHLHEFIVPRNPRNLTKRHTEAICQIKMRSFDDDFIHVSDDEEPMIEDTVLLSQMFSVFPGIQYIYDFGDGWFHTIKFKKVFFSTKDYPELLSASGLRPPEDIGGETGYEIFQQAIKALESGKYDESYFDNWGYGSEEDFASWVEHWKALDRPIALVNKKLRKLHATPPWKLEQLG